MVAGWLQEALTRLDCTIDTSASWQAEDEPMGPVGLGLVLICLIRRELWLAGGLIDRQVEGLIGASSFESKSLRNNQLVLGKSESASDKRRAPTGVCQLATCEDKDRDKGL